MAAPGAAGTLRAAGGGGGGSSGGSKLQLLLHRTDAEVRGCSRQHAWRTRWHVGGEVGRRGGGKGVCTGGGEAATRATRRAALSRSNVDSPRGLDLFRGFAPSRWRCRREKQCWGAEATVAQDGRP
eukprot:361209-Chlamydomonas_euryale.AAC.1